nr:immunoglobulin light chain junction region [Macaca mulatta]
EYYCWLYYGGSDLF